jgi:hypothetical protein
MIVPLIIIIFIVIIIGRILTLYLDKKGKKADARGIKFLTIIIVLMFICILFFNLYLSYEESKEHIVALSIVKVETESYERNTFTVKFSNEEKLIQKNITVNDKIELNTFKRNNEFYFEIESQDFRFLNFNRSISGILLTKDYDLRIEDINASNDYYRIIVNEDDDIQIQTIGNDGNLTFRFRIFPTVIS